MLSVRLKHELDSEIEMHRKEMADLEAPLEGVLSFTTST